MRYTLQKSEILRGYRAFSSVLSHGRSVGSGPVRCFLLCNNEQRNALLVGFCVSRGVRNAVDRNRIRRWMREAYRKNKQLLAPKQGSTQKNVTVVFLGSAKIENSRSAKAQKVIEQSMISLLRELHHQLGGTP